MFSPHRDRSAYQAEWSNRELVRSARRPSSDPLSAGATERRAFGSVAVPLRGVVADSVAYAGCYRVLLEMGRPPLPCVLAGMTSFQPVGARSATTLVPGSVVWVLLHPQADYGVIICVEPDMIVDPSQGFSDFHHQAGRCGLRVDRTQSAVFNLADAGGVVDWSAGRPFDATSIGEWGAITETGLRVLLDPAMAQLGVDEQTGFFAFLHDGLARVGGRNLQIQATGLEFEHINDQGELSGYRGVTPYPWEAHGALRLGVDPFREIDPQASQVDQPHYAAVEPRSDNQQAFHRVVELSGYLGQGGKKLVQAPPSGDLWQYSDGEAPKGLFEESTTLAGRHLIRSASGIHIAKRPAIPAPRRVRRPESPAGDTEQNYRPAGATGYGPPHDLKGGLTGGGELPHLARVAGVGDVHAAAFNWEAAHPLHHHAADWKLPDEDEAAVPRNQEPVTFERLAKGFYLPRPEPVKVPVDHRYGEVDCYPNESYISLLEDGGVAIGDGYGAEIRLVGGHIFLTCPGDLWLQPGRNINAMAGRDAIVRARNSIDLSATMRDVRLKAERNVQVLSGNSGVGAVMIESRANPAFGYKDKQGEDVVSGGIHLKAGKGAVVQWAREIYLRTGGGDVQGGDITIDANRGKNQVYTHASSAIRYLQTSAADYFGRDGEVKTTNLYSANSNVFGSAIYADGTVEILKGGLIVRGWLAVAEGHIVTELANQYRGQVPTYGPEDLARIYESLRQGEEAIDELKKGAVETYEQVFKDYWYKDGGAGEDDTIRDAGFSFRTTEQYMAKEFKLFEARWQRMARESGRDMAVWKEKAVKSGSVDTYPYPGREPWAEKKTLLRQDLTLVDPATGTAKARDSETYAAAELAEPEGVVPNDEYTVIF